MRRSSVLSITALGVLAALTACDPNDREKMFSSDRAPLVGRCDPQPGYPDPSVRKGCEYQQLITRGR